ncbi:phage portal protein [Acidisphaera sp. L21]|uniref:phage portal protein n=1 Tax=Acidisphaera sp. L21 TaxID=1641851 RepID=UPI00131D3373|nr:phage portal protein [Acidisphaera sp. L21]
MFQTICDLIPSDPGMPERARRLDILRRALNGTLYDVLPHDFHEERTQSGDYIPLRLRRPSVRYAMARIVTEDSVALLFSEGHFPTVDSPDHATRDTLAALLKSAHLNEIMIDAALRGSIGSIAILMRILGGRPFFSVLDTINLTPCWRPDAPDTLASVTERYKLPGANFAAAGYAIPDIGETYWFTRCWDDQAEIWYLPQPVSDIGPPQRDPDRSITHGLDFVPLAWVRNLPGASWTNDPADGACTFRAAIETSIEIDYQLSQAGRGLKYSSDPTLLIKEPAGLDGEMIRGAGNALVVSEHGDAKLLEIGGTASAAVIEYVRTLREFALESVHGNRADASRLSAATSGRALELMNQGLLWLADNLRISYGEGAILTLARMVLRAGAKYQLRLGDAALAKLDEHAPLSLIWPHWYPSSSVDRQNDAQTLATLTAAGLMSKQTAVKSLADAYDVEDIPAELNRIAESTPPSDPKHPNRDKE